MEPTVVTLRDMPAPLFAMVQPIYRLTDGREQVTFHLFTAEGVRSRTAQRRSGGDWFWLCFYGTGEPLPWGAPTSYDDETPEQRRAWHEREHGWAPITVEVA